ncbi:MAG: phosphoribosylamine--glycine ligase [Granulosicoccaceae bacterium]
MHILLIGSGGREHAMAWKLAQSEKSTVISVAPGSDAIGLEKKVECIDIASNDFAALAAYAKKESVSFTIVGPEVPLVDGIVDFFQSTGLRILGPSAAAAQLEGSKAFAKEFMQQHNIPTARYATFTDIDKAITYIKQHDAPLVIKADGLAAGKGVVVADTHAVAIDAVKSMLSELAFGDAGSNVVIEEFLPGEEASFIVLVDGEHSLPFASSQDHKARDEGDSGPNTGGMGAYSPAPVINDSIHQQVMNTIVQPTINAFRKNGTPYVGFLYVGLMIDANSVAKVVEYNVRLGDPETQPLMMRLDSDLVTLCLATIDGQLDQHGISWSRQSAIGVVLAAGEYPAGSSRGATILGIGDADALGCKVFHAGSRIDGEQVTTNGGRVLCVTALGNDIREAKTLADQGANKISWPGMHRRRDIGYRALARLN